MEAMLVPDDCAVSHYTLYWNTVFSVCFGANMSLVSVTDAVSNITGYAINGTNVVVPAMLGVIMIARLHAMYQRSRMMLIFLVIIFLAVIIACGIIMAIGLKDTVVGKFYLLT
ncbi:hypothetical protein EV702DRAFT_198345 [Suillus placidus]|uniref:Uncharacterized protein n=1 Tax=Suillus placidus TaxID=48579 RepID=A0A9P6ZW13_9AGAM|nr:hypothetical protein EV702DRAFT_198345 [Suillus placidus]